MITTILLAVCAIIVIAALGGAVISLIRPAQEGRATACATVAITAAAACWLIINVKL